MSIIGPRETHDYRNYNLLGSGTIKSKKKTKNNTCSETAPKSGIFTREWSKASVKMDCNSFEATIGMK